VRHDVHLDVVEAEDLRALDIAAAQPGADPGDQFLGRERLGDVVVGAGLQAEDHVDRVGLGRQHHDRDTGFHPDLATDLQPVLAGQHQVEQHQVGACLVEGCHGLVTRADEDGLEALLTEHDTEHLAERRVVVDDQNPAFHQNLRMPAAGASTEHTSLTCTPCPTARIAPRPLASGQMPRRGHQVAATVPSWTTARRGPAVARRTPPEGSLVDRTPAETGGPAEGPNAGYPRVPPGGASPDAPAGPWQPAGAGQPGPGPGHQPGYQPGDLYGPGYRPKAGGARTGPLPMHPMTFGDILDGAFKLLKANFFTLILVTAVFLVPLSMFSAWTTRNIASPGILEVLNNPAAAPATNPLAGFNWAASFLSVLVSLLITPLVAGVVSRVVASSYLGTQLTAGEALSGTVRHFPALLVSFLLVHLCELVGLAACLVGAVFLMPLFLVTSPAIVAENMGPYRGMIRGITRSVELTTSRYWPVLGIGVLSGLVAELLESIVSFPLSALVALFGSMPWPIAGFVTLLPILLTTPLVTIVAVLVYFDLRIRREGLDLQMLAAGLGRDASRVA
jgi:hypothetical protein